MEGKSSTQKTENERFRQLILSNLTLVSGSEFKKFLSVECDWNSKISQNVPNLGFLKTKCVVSQKFLDFCQFRTFCHIIYNG